MELIEHGKFYYHNALRIMPPPPVSFIDEDGNLVFIREPKFSIEARRSFTDRDLLQYYLDKFKIEPIKHPDEYKRFINALSYMVTRHGLDTVLFAIDYYRDIMQISDIVPPPDVPFDIQKYLANGRETMEIKKAREEGEGIRDGKSS